MDIKVKMPEREKLVCPKCNLSAFLYKEILGDGRYKIICDKQGCDYESEVSEHPPLDTFSEKQRNWQ